MIEIDNILDAEKYINDVYVVIFDLDDTLYSEKDYVRSGYKKIAQYFRIPQMADEMWSVFGTGGKAIDEVLEKHKIIEKKSDALHVYRYQKPDIHLYDGVSNMIARISINKKIGIITDGRPEGQRAKLAALGLQVDKVIITDELGGIEFRKPNEISFRLMQKYFNVPFAQMVYIGDNIKKDFVAPERLGMQSIWFKNPDGLYV